MHDRPAHLAEAAVNAPDSFLDLLAGGAIVLDALARRGRDLDKRDVVELALLKQRLDGQQALQDALGVIQAVHAEKQVLRATDGVA